MNMTTMREWKGQREGEGPGESEVGAEAAANEGGPRPVLWFAGTTPSSDGDGDNTKTAGPDPLCPLDLLMAYEEDGRVTPVVSDFDCFLLGTRGVRYQQPLRALDREMLHWCVDQIEGILAQPKRRLNWTQRWLSVKKMQVQRDRKGTRGAKPVQSTTPQTFQELPKFGYADPTSYSMMRGAVGRLKGNGAVRHGETYFVAFSFERAGGMHQSLGQTTIVSLQGKMTMFTCVHLLRLNEYQLFGTHARRPFF